MLELGVWMLCAACWHSSKINEKGMLLSLLAAIMVSVCVRIWK